MLVRLGKNFRGNTSAQRVVAGNKLYLKIKQGNGVIFLTEKQVRKLRQSV